MKVCNVCSYKKPFEDFDFKKNKGYSGYCKDCRREKIRQHYRDNKQYYVDKAGARNSKIRNEHRQILIEYLRKHPCIDCGNSDIEVLEFDHRDQKEKTCEVHKLIISSTEKLFKEIEKCDVRCANCHVKRTRRQLGWWTDQ